MKEKVKNIIKEMTLEEKASLCSGADFWKLKSVERLGLPQIMVTDGPHGLRKQGGDSDHVGLNESVAATCFPTAVTTASSWDRDLMHEIGVALGEECLQEDVSVILGPGANIKRSPLCGRNFEYISEDPYHTGKIAAALINGVQSQGIGTSLKHFVMNNQEERRMTIDAVVDERAQREIYLKGFEIAVKESQPWTVMCSYNRVDGTYLSDNKRLLTDILKEEWGHTGLVVTDWGATNDRVEGIKAGLELEMPSSYGKNDEKIVAAVKEGKLSEDDLDKAVKRIVEIILKSTDARREGYKYDADAHMQLARKAASNSAVLLKNEGLLPLNKSQNVTIIGEFAKKPRYQGAGSSLINPHKVVSTCDELDEQGIKYSYAQGYSIKNDKPEEAMIEEAKKAAKEAEAAVVFVGLTDEYESEGFDRSHIMIPEGHSALIEAVAEVNPNTVVVLQNGAPIEMPWIDKVNAVLECYLGGQAGGAAAVDLLYGDVNPSGKIAETFPIKIEDNPSYKHFPGNALTVEYRESIYVGYRYYDKANKDVLFPFGHGLSYTEFEYSNLLVANKKDKHTVSFDVKNIGKADGAEIVQLYVKNAPSKIFKAQKELRAFDKVFLKAGEKRTVTFDLSADAFSYYNVGIGDWHTEAGEYEILIGASSRDIRLSEKVQVQADKKAETPDYSSVLTEYYNLTDEVLDISEKQFETLYGRKLPMREKPEGSPFSINSTLGETEGKFIGRMLMNMMVKNIKKMVGNEAPDEENSMMRLMMAMVKEMPIRSFAMLGGEKMPKYMAEGLVEMLNGKFFKGMGMLMKK